MVGVKVVVEDGSYHEVDSSDKAFQACARGCFRETFKMTKPTLLEPIMKMAVECPEEFQGNVTGDLISRRAIVVSSEIREAVSYLDVEIPLAETVGYISRIRSLTKGQGDFTMELFAHRKIPVSIQEDVIAERKQQLVGAK